MPPKKSGTDKWKQIKDLKRLKPKKDWKEEDMVYFGPGADKLNKKNAEKRSKEHPSFHDLMDRIKKRRDEAKTKPPESGSKVA